MPRTSIDKRDAAAYAVILAAVSVSFINALANGFVYDDLHLITMNTRLRMGWEGIPVIFSTGYWQTGGGLYRPLSILALLFEHALGGYNPFIYHLDNVLLHFVCSLLVYVISKQLLKGRSAALFAAVLFAVHPVHTEAVAWVSGKAELLSALFTLVSFWLYLKEPGRRLFTALSYTAFFLALMSKETAVVLPILLAAYIMLYSPGQGLSGRLKKAAGLYPYAAVFVIYILIRFAVIGKLGPTGEEAILWNLTPYNLFLEMCEALYNYMRLGFFPVSLHMDYFFLPAKTIFYYRVAVPLVLTALIAVFARRLARTSGPFLFAALWFYIALLPVSNIIPIGIIMSERAMYLPSVGICMILGLWFSAAYESASAKRLRYLVAAMFILAAGLLAAGSINRNPVWKDQKQFSKRLMAVWKRQVELVPTYEPYYADLLKAYIQTGNYGPEAEATALKAISLDRTDPKVHYFLAMIYSQRGRLIDALNEVKTSIKLHEFANSYNLAGGILCRMGRYEESDAMSARAVELAPNNVMYRDNRAYNRMKMGDPDTAYKILEGSLRIMPDDVHALIGQGEILNGKGQYALAAEKLEKAVALDPDKEDGHFNLAVSYMNTGRTELARQELEKTLSINPANEQASGLLLQLNR
jgi:protein O-mannosyl-transferase